MKYVKSLLLSVFLVVACTPTNGRAADVTVVAPLPNPHPKQCWYRSSITGRFVTKEQAEKQPMTTVKECRRAFPRRY